jgi:hypothetical protein
MKIGTEWDLALIDFRAILAIEPVAKPQKK